MAMERPVPWYGVVTWFVFTGIVAVGWAYSFTLNRKFIAVVIPFSFLAPPLLRHWFHFLPGMVPHDSFDGPLALITIAALVAGYVLFISFISTEGARTMRLQTEIRLAQQIHARLVPPIDRRIGRLQCYGRSDSSSEVGGDLLDVVEKEGRVGAFVADVSGHGVRAGVLMAMIKSAARMRLLSDDSLDGLMDDLNRVVMQVKEMDMFVTVPACNSTAPTPPASSWRGIHRFCTTIGRMSRSPNWRATTRRPASLPICATPPARFPSPRGISSCCSLMAFSRWKTPPAINSVSPASRR
jgi:hypothetical protein